MNKEISAVILAAGNSTRMKSLTANCPKPMLEIGNRPMMEYVLQSLKNGGIDNVVVTTHYLSEVIESYFGNGSRLGMKISYAYEQDLLNTAGSLAVLKNQISDDVLVCGGHFVLPGLNIADVINFHRTTNGAGTIVFKRFEESNLLKFFGQGLLDQNQRLVGFQEKPTYLFSNLVHTTYQIYRREVLELIPSKVPLSIPEFLILRLLSQPETFPLYGYITDKDLLNVSTQELYDRTQKLVSNGVLGQLTRELEFGK